MRCRKALLHLLEIKHVGVEIVEDVLDDRSREEGKSISELQLPWDSSILVVIRSGDFLIPSGQLVLQSGDELIALCRAKQE